MSLPPDCLAAIAGARAPSSGPLPVPFWPMPGNLGGLVLFSTFAEWRSFVLAPQPAPGYSRSRREEIRARPKAARPRLGRRRFDQGRELVAMTALELALFDRYAGAETQRRRRLVASKAESEKRKILKSEKWWTEYVVLRRCPRPPGRTRRPD